MLTIKKSNLLLLLLTLICITSVIAVSCHSKINKGGDRDKITIEIPEDKSGLDKIDHFINERTVAAYKSTFKSQQEQFRKINVHVPDAEAFNKRALLSLLKAPDCVGIRIYHGAKTGKRNNNESELRLVLVGVDSKGNDILIDRSSVLAAKLTADLGGLESGQCPSCLSDFQ